jgi:hypothetical protein
MLQAQQARLCVPQPSVPALCMGAARLAAREALATRSYDWSKPTSFNYGSPERRFFGPYASIRANLDFAYHGNYLRARQAIQDELITALLRENDTSQPGPNPNPWVVFTCGAMGAGKSHVVTWMK